MEARKMSGETVRFLHASDLKLGAPLFGVAGLPANVRDCMINARYRAAERVFDVALAEGADFVVLSGNVISELGAGPRGLWFFTQQCERLARRNISVYWVEESRAQVRWSDYVPLPANVFLAESQLGQTFEHHCRRGDVRIAAGLERRPPAGRRRTIAVLPEGLDGLPLSQFGVDYWALGGRSEPGAVPALSGLAQFAGTPQGHDPSETGPRGCVLVNMDDAGQCTSQFITTDSVRWHDERVQIGDGLDWTRLRQLLPARQQQIVRACDSDAVMIRWTLAGHGGLWQQLQRDDVCRQLLGTLFKARAASGPAVWNLVIDVVPDAKPATEWSPVERAFREVAASQPGDRRFAPDAGAGPHFVRQRVRQRLHTRVSAASDVRS
jgi:hypothetical protein